MVQHMRVRYLKKCTKPIDKTTGKFRTPFAKASLDRCHDETSEKKERHTGDGSLADVTEANTNAADYGDR